MENERNREKIEKLEKELSEIQILIGTWDAELADLEEEAESKIIGLSIVSRIGQARQAISSLKTRESRIERELAGLRR